jgi:hypothetical protein
LDVVVVDGHLPMGDSGKEVMSTQSFFRSLWKSGVVAVSITALLCLPRFASAQLVGEVDVTYRDRIGGLTTSTFGTQPNGSGPNLAQGDIWTAYLNNLSPDGSSGNAIIVTPVVDPILDLIIDLRNDSTETWTELTFTLPDVPGIGFFNYINPGPPLSTPTSGGHFRDFEFLSPNGTLANDGTGNSQQLYREIRFYNSNPAEPGILPGEENFFRWVAFFPDPPPSGPVSYPIDVRPNGAPGRIPEPATVVLGLSILLPAGVLRLRRRGKQSA